MQIKPTLSLFVEFYYYNRQTKYSGGPALECGGVTIQKRAKSIFPAPKMMSKVKDWQKSFFYFTVEAIKGEHPLPSFHGRQLEFHGSLNLFPTEVHHKRNEPILDRMKA